jgi:hypothetical protein
MNAPSNADVESPVEEFSRSLDPYQVAIPWPEAVRAYLAKHPER